MLSIYSHARAYLGIDKQVVIDTEDTYIYVQSAYVAQELPGLKLYRSSKDNNFIDCKALCSSEIAEVVIQLHVLTGRDSNSPFFGIGKKRNFNNLRGNEDARILLKSCGVSLNIDKSTIYKLTNFVLKYIYNDHIKVRMLLRLELRKGSRIIRRNNLWQGYLLMKTH